MPVNSNIVLRKFHKWSKMRCHRSRWINLDDSYDISYKCCVPERVEAILVADGCIYARHEAIASVRSTGSCMAGGQAMGTAFTLARRRRCSSSPREGQEAAVDADGTRRFPLPLTSSSAGRAGLRRLSRGEVSQTKAEVLG